MVVKLIKDLEKRKIISRKPNPILPFILGFVILVLGILVQNLEVNKLLGYLLLSLAGFTFIFAILHLIVVRILKK